MQVEDEDDIDIGGNEGDLIANKPDINAENRLTIPEASEDTDNVEDSAQYTVHVAPDYQEPSWESHSSIDTSDMDEKSKALIQQMLAEEEYYFGAGTNSLDHDDYPEPKPKKRKVQKRESKGSNAGDASYKSTPQEGHGKLTISSAELPSHKTRWSAEEDQKLKDALAKYTYGNWKAVAEAVGTRNALQCKNHARHLVNSSKIAAASETSIDSAAANANAGLEIIAGPPKDSNTSALSNLQQDIYASSNINENDGMNVAEMEVDRDQVSLDTKAPLEANGDDIEVDIDENGQTEQVINGSSDAGIEDTSLSAGNADTKLEERSVPSISAAVVDQKEENATEEKDEIAVQVIKQNPLSDSADMELLLEQKSLASPEERTIHQENGVDEMKNEEEGHLGTNGSRNDTASTVPSSRTTAITLISDIPRKMEDSEGESIQQETQLPDTGSEEKQFDPHNASENEIKNNREWFLGKSSKTPERYLKIRNTMLAAWRRCRPRYLTKTSARNGLKDCGDVNAIGRVHTYLESIGAINVNCITNPPRPKRPAASQVEYLSDEDEQGVGHVADWLMDYEGPRKRKVRDERGHWVDPKDLEGRVIEHGVAVEEVKARPKRTIRRPKHLHDDDFRHGYDPFRLVPLEQYDEGPPFKVDIVSDALIVMDFHSYLAHTEIIGLLGGKFDAENRRLEVQCTFPCKSTSTGIQCEMDPESEMRAREVFAEKGMAVVGWYHSHPTFEPNPSVRDIENQSSYQSLFRHEETGLEPFIGVIVSPYDHTPETDMSKFQYLSISPGWDASGSFRMPFACETKILQCTTPASDIYPQLQVLVEEYCDYEHRVDMSEPFPKDGTNSRLDKLLASLAGHLVPESNASAEFLNQVRQLVTEKLPPPPPKSGSGGNQSVKNDEHLGSVTVEDTKPTVTSLMEGQIS